MNKNKLKIERKKIPLTAIRKMKVKVAQSIEYIYIYFLAIMFRGKSFNIFMVHEWLKEFQNVSLNNEQMYTLIDENLFCN